MRRYTLPGEPLTAFASGDRCYGLVVNQWIRGVIQRTTERCVVIFDPHANRDRLPRRNCVKALQVLTPSQGALDKIAELWYIYGNHGPEHSDMNHHFIQAFLEENDLDLQWHNTEFRTQITRGLAQQIYDLLGIEVVGSYNLIKMQEPEHQ